MDITDGSMKLPPPNVFLAAAASLLGDYSTLPYTQTQTQTIINSNSNASTPILHRGSAASTTTTTPTVNAKHEWSSFLRQKPPLPAAAAVSSTAMTEECVYKSGYALKKGRRGWRKRWFVLRSAHLAIYDSSQEYEIKHVLPLTFFRAVLATPLSHHPHALSVVIQQQQMNATATYVLDARSRAELEEWVRACEEALSKLPNRHVLVWRPFSQEEEEAKVKSEPSEGKEKTTTTTTLMVGMKLGVVVVDPWDLQWMQDNKRPHQGEIEKEEVRATEGQGDMTEDEDKKEKRKSDFSPLALRQWAERLPGIAEWVSREELSNDDSYSQAKAKGESKECLEEDLKAEESIKKDLKARESNEEDLKAEESIKKDLKARESDEEDLKVEESNEEDLKKSRDSKKTLKARESTLSVQTNPAVMLKDASPAESSSSSASSVSFTSETVQVPPTILPTPWIAQPLPLERSGWLYKRRRLRHLHLTTSNSNTSSPTSSTTAPSTPTDGTGAFSQQQVRKKVSTSHGTYLAKWCTLRGSKLSWYEDSGEYEVKGMLDMDSVVDIVPLQPILQQQHHSNDPLPSRLPWRRKPTVAAPISPAFSGIDVFEGMQTCPCAWCTLGRQWSEHLSRQTSECGHLDKCCFGAHPPPASTHALCMYWISLSQHHSRVQDQVPSLHAMLFPIQLVLPKRSFYFATTSEQERQQWLAALRRTFIQSPRT